LARGVDDFLGREDSVAGRSQRRGEVAVEGLLSVNEEGGGEIERARSLALINLFH